MAQREVDVARGVRSCLSCNRRLPNIRFDTHTFCSKCRGQLCDFDISCDECRDWTPDFRRQSLAYIRKLKQKRESKRRRLAGTRSPLSQADDDDNNGASSDFDSEVSAVVTSPFAGPSNLQPSASSAPQMAPDVPHLMFCPLRLKPL